MHCELTAQDYCVGYLKTTTLQTYLSAYTISTPPSGNKNTISDTFVVGVLQISGKRWQTKRFWDKIGKTKCSVLSSWQKKIKNRELR